MLVLSFAKSNAVAIIVLNVCVQIEFTGGRRRRRRRGVEPRRKITRKRGQKKGRRAVTLCGFVRVAVPPYSLLAAIIQEKKKKTWLTKNLAELPFYSLPYSSGNPRHRRRKRPRQ